MNATRTRFRGRHAWWGVLALLTAAGLGGAAGSPARAEGRVRMSWAACPSVQAYAQVLPAPGASGTVTVWIGGLAGAHAGYHLELTFANADRFPLADAWRFDARGCEGEERMTFEAGPPPGPGACAALIPALFDSLRATRDVSYDAGRGRLRAALDVRYWPTAPAADPGREYLLAYVAMDLSSMIGGSSRNGLCGGLERGLCLWVSGGGTLEPGGGLVAWDRGEAVVTAANATTQTFSCGSVPAAPATWGRLKATYRD